MIALTAEGVHAFYGKSHILHGVSLEVREGEIVALLGATAPARRRRCAASSASRGPGAGR